MDAKKRVAIPPVWLSREGGEEFYVVLHPTKEYLVVMNPAEFVRMQERLASSGLSQQEQQQARRLLFGGAHRVVTDAQGRVLLAEEHCRGAGLNSQVAFVGSGSRFEIWDAGRFAAKSAQLQDFFVKAAESIGL